MKILLNLLFVLFINSSFYAQTDFFNLKDIDSLSIKVQDVQNFLSPNIKQKIITETKLKLKSAGITITQDNSQNQFIISVEAIQSNFAEHRILLHIGISEKVQTFRKNKEITNAFTYYDESFFKGKDIEASIYSEYMDKLIIRFIERYLSVN